MDSELSEAILEELVSGVSPKKGGSLGSILGKILSKITPIIAKHAPKVIPALGLAAATGAISGASEKAVKGGGQTRYIKYGLSLSDAQQKRVRMATDGLTVRLKHNQLNGNDYLMLTPTQVSKIQKLKAMGKGLDLKLSRNQLKESGGFWGPLLAGVAAPAITKMLGLGHEKKLTKNNGQGLRLPGSGLRMPGT